MNESMRRMWSIQPEEHRWILRSSLRWWRAISLDVRLIVSIEGSSLVPRRFVGKWGRPWVLQRFFVHRHSIISNRAPTFIGDTLKIMKKASEFFHLCWSSSLIQPRKPICSCWSILKWFERIPCEIRIGEIFARTARCLVRSWWEGKEESTG